MTFDPYAPPKAPAPVPSGGRRGVPYAVYALGGGVLLHSAAAAGSELLALPESQLRTLDVLGTLVRIAFGIAGVSWLAAAFRRLPIRHRDLRFVGGRIIGRFFIPIFNLYWMFATTSGLCDIVNAGLAERDRPRTAPGHLAAIACIVHVVDGVVARLTRGEESVLWALVGVTSPVLWLLFTYRTESALRDLDDAVAAIPEEHA